VNAPPSSGTAPECASARPFIGREPELAYARELLGRARLLTVHGPGGVGKTRFARALAGSVAGDFDDGVRELPLAAIATPLALGEALATALGLRIGRVQDPRDAILQHLAERRMLLVLDSFEHLMESTALIHEILVTAPGVRVVVTSRRRLGIRRETTLELGGLGVPEDGREDDSACEAVRFFAESARRVRPDFYLPDELEAVVRICRHVGGLPLALELAAAWARTLSCADIAREIERSTDFLDQKIGEVESWHPGLRSVFDVAWGRLSDEERRVFRELCIFRREFSRGAAVWVTGSTPMVLGELTDRALLRRTASGRYEIHEVVRQCGLVRLAEIDGELDRVADVHAEHYAAFLQLREARLAGNGQSDALDEILTEIENVRAGWARAVERLRLDLLERYDRPLYRVYLMRSWIREGDQELARAAERVRHAETVSHPERRRRVLGLLLARRGSLLYRVGAFDEARRILTEAVGLLRERSDLDLAWALNSMGNLHVSTGQVSEAVPYYREVQELALAHADRETLILALHNLGNTALLRKDLEEAERSLRACWVILRDTGDRWRESLTAISLGRVLLERGFPEEASRLAHEGYELGREVGDPWGLAAGAVLLADVHLGLGDREAARRWARESLRLALDSQSSVVMLDVLATVAALRLEEGADAAALSLLGLVFAHPSSEGEVRSRAAGLWERVRARASAGEVEHAVAGAAAVDLEALVRTLLARETVPA
jgi:predicted ATPase